MDIRGPTWELGVRYRGLLLEILMSGGGGS